MAQQSGLTSAVQELAGELLPRTPELARGMAEHLYAAIPELSAIEDDELRAELLASTEANIGQVLRLLADGASADDVVIPHEALEFLRGNVRRGIPLAALLRSYRLGHAWLWERWSQALQERVEDSGELIAGQDQSSAFMFAYVDKVSDALVEEFGTERDRMMRSATQLRAETVRAILAGEPIDEEVAVPAAWLRAAAPARGAADRQPGKRGARPRTRGRRGRGCPRQRRAARCRLGRRAFRRLVGLVRRSGNRRRSRTTSRPPGVLVAFGRPGKGIAGFRSSHAEALQAARVASLAGGAAVTSYARRRAGLTAGRRPAAGASVRRRPARAARRRRPSRPQRLRDTVLAFLASGGSATRAAKELYVHQNTVAYRVKRAEELLDRKVSERLDRADLRAEARRRPRFGRAGGHGQRRRSRGSGVERVDLGWRRARMGQVPNCRCILVAAPQGPPGMADLPCAMGPNRPTQRPRRRRKRWA